MLEKLRKHETFIPVLLSIVILIVLLILPTGYEGALNYQQADRVKAVVLSSDESNVVDMGLVRTGEQHCYVRILGGKFRGEETDAVNRLNGSMAQDKIFSIGDTAYVVASHSNGEITTVTMSDHYRLGKEAALAGLFLLLLLLSAMCFFITVSD